jgi:hypothetical protein
MDPPTYRVVQVADEVVRQERRRRIEDARDIEYRARRPLRTRRKRPERPLEQHWHECLAFPFLTWRWLLGLAVVFSLVSAAAVSWVSDAAAPDAGFAFDPQSDFILKWFFRALFAGAAFAFGSSYVYWVIRAAADGEPPHGNWPVFDMRLLIRGVGCVLAALLAGPVELAVLGFFYWMECGDVSWLDGIILAELVVLGVGCGLFALAAAARNGRAEDLNPLRAFELAQRLGTRGVLLALFAAAAVLAHGWLALGAIEQMHVPHNGFGGWLLLTCCWLSALLVASFVLRVLGRWCDEDKRALPELAVDAA